MLDLYNLKDELARRKDAASSLEEMNKSLTITGIIGGVASIAVIALALFNVAIPATLLSIFGLAKVLIPAITGFVALILGGGKIAHDKHIKAIRKLKEDIAITEVEYAKEREEFKAKKLQAENAKQSEVEHTAEVVEEKTKPNSKMGKQNTLNLGI